MPDLLPSRAARRGTAAAVLALSLTATGFAAWREHVLARREQTIRFQDSYSQLQPAMLMWFGTRFDQLRDMARSTLCRDQYSETGWKEFVKDSNWRGDYHGMKEIGYAEFTGDECVVKFVDGDFPPSQAPGTDLAADPIIRQTLQKSADAGYGAATKPLQGGEGTNAAPTVFGVLPLPPLGKRPGTAAENRASLRGFLFYTLDQGRYFRWLEPQMEKMPFVYRLLAADEIAPPNTTIRRSVGLTTLSGQWRFLVTMKDPTAAELAPEWLVGLAGIILSGLLYFLFASQARLRFASEFAGQRILEREAEIVALNRDLEKRISERTAELARFKAIIEATSDFVGMASLDGRTIYVNSAGRRLMEFPDGFDPAGLEMDKYYPEDVNRFFCEVAVPQAMRDGYWAGETRLLTWKGREVPVSFVGLVIKSSNGAPLHLSCIARDISERKAAEAKLQDALERQKELNRLKSNFVSMVTHEIRTPLAHILGSSEILSRYLDRLPAEKRAEHFGFINSAVQRMSRLMEDVLLFSKAEAGRMDFKPLAMDLQDFCRHLADEVLSATGRRCPIQVRLEDVAQPARGDENLLRHIFTNLLTNAVKYSPPGSPVVFSVARRDGSAVFSVQDRGAGIPEDDRKRLFRPFHRGKNVAALPGTGLGLLIVKHCVERHGGSIEIASAENAGTEVCVRLPLFSPAHTEFVARYNNQSNNHEKNPDHR